MESPKKPANKTAAAANKTAAAAEEPSEAPSEAKKKAERPKPSSSGAAAEEEEGGRKPKRGPPRVDANGAPLSFGKDENCAICLDTLRTPIRLDCGHWYCKDCVEGLRQSESAPDSCPLCRDPLPPGAEQLWDEARQKGFRLHRKVERRGKGYTNLPRALRREMNEVLSLLTQAAAQEHSESQYMLGTLYRDGEAVPMSWRIAKKWFEQAASHEHAEALYNLGHMRHMGTAGSPVDFVEARELYEKAAVLGHAPARTFLGTMIFRGDGGPEDFALARTWWDQSAAQGHAGAMISIALMYQYEQGEEQDLNEAMRWYLKAKAHGANVDDSVKEVMAMRKRGEDQGAPVQLPANAIMNDELKEFIAMRKREEDQRAAVQLPAPIPGRIQIHINPHALCPEDPERAREVLAAMNKKLALGPWET